MVNREILRRVDWLLVAAIGLLLVIGEQAVRAVTQSDFLGDPGYFVRRHIIYIALGLTLAAVAVLVDPRVYRRLFWFIYGGTIGLLIVVLGFSA
ncbi:MAG: FtsW/RodA/SpoVE family cell cycle protein, partial [Actinomycetota bacterium]